ncbi:MAG: DUF4307 domain-containing protein [Actinobacteria bacterium]|nr:DUF4307 domain-containing protein [Actinomycetota bacterium]MCA1721712.1 DUF4307 domain-containing protein [Actinomycetota bacterium]
MPPDQRRRPPGRYDDARRSSRVLVLVAAVVVGLLVSAFAVRLYQRRTEGTVPFETRGFAVSSPAEVKVVWEVSLDRGDRAECQLKARGRSGEQVGLEVVPVGPGTGRELVVEHLLATSARASTAEVTACRTLVAP